MGSKTKVAFSLGQILATPGAIQALDEGGHVAAEFLDRHARGDWGDVCDEDALLNDQALSDGSRILSAYKTSRGVKIWIITEAGDESGQRPATTLLLPEEY